MEMQPTGILWIRCSSGSALPISLAGKGNGE